MIPMSQPEPIRYACGGCGTLNEPGDEVCSGCGFRFAGSEARSPSAGSGQTRSVADDVFHLYTPPLRPYRSPRHRDPMITRAYVIQEVKAVLFWLLVIALVISTPMLTLGAFLAFASSIENRTTAVVLGAIDCAVIAILVALVFHFFRNRKLKRRGKVQ